MRMTTRRSTIIPATLLLALAALLTGCGSVGNTNSARIRVVDLASNGTSVNANAISNIFINNGSAFGDMTFFKASPYLYIGTGLSTFGFSSSATTVTSATLPVVQQTLDSGHFYTIFLVGRPDVVASDPRFLKDIVATDAQGSPTAGQAAVRIVQAAPDAGSVDILINGAVAVPGVAFKTISDYVTIAPGTLSVQVNAAGTNTIIIPATSIPVAAGQSYTLAATEPTTTPTYALKTLSP